MKILFKPTVFSLLAVVFFTTCSQQPEKKIHKQTKNPVKIILDTDIASNHDDVGAIAVLHSLANSGEAEILAMAISETGESARWGAPCVDAINTYFNRPDIPIGVPAHGFEKNLVGYSRQIAQQFPYTLDTIWDATKLYRKVLSEQPDTSVVIVTIGFMTNIANLLKSKPDEFSNLNGLDLIKKKAKQWVCMAGNLVEGGRGTNITSDAPTTKFAFENWPRPILFTGTEIGSKILTGKRLPYMEDQPNPVHLAATIGTCSGCGNASSDQITVLAAVRAVKRYWDINSRGYCSMSDNPDIGLKWMDKPDKDHSYIKERIPNIQMQDTIEDLMMDLPNKSRQAFFTLPLDNTIQIVRNKRFGYKLPYYNFNKGDITLIFKDFPDWISYLNDSIFGMAPDTIAFMKDLFTVVLFNNNMASDTITVSVSVLKKEPLISNVQYASGYNYVSTKWLKENERFYADRNRTIKSIPDDFKNSLWLISPINTTSGKYYQGEKFVTFNINTNANIFIGYDADFLDFLPGWLNDWENTGKFIIDNSDRKYLVFNKLYNKGKVVLGNLTTHEKVYKPMYLILVKEVR